MRWKLRLPYDRFLRQALKEAERAFEAGEVPVVAVVVREGKVIGRGHNRREALRNTTAPGIPNALAMLIEHQDPDFENRLKSGGGRSWKKVV